MKTFPVDHLKVLKAYYLTAESLRASFQDLKFFVIFNKNVASSARALESVKFQKNWKISSETPLYLNGSFTNFCEDTSNLSEGAHKILWKYRVGLGFILTFIIIFFFKIGNFRAPARASARWKPQNFQNWGKIRKMQKFTVWSIIMIHIGGGSFN